MKLCESDFVFVRNVRDWIEIQIFLYLEGKYLGKWSFGIQLVEIFLIYEMRGV